MTRANFDFLKTGACRVTAHCALALAAVSPGLMAQSAEDLHMTVGKSLVIDYPSDVRQISTSNPDIIDASPVTTREILVHGKGLGNATMIVWSRGGERTFYNVTVDLNLDPLKKIYKDTFPNEDINPVSSRDSLTLNGRVSAKDVADRAVALAANFAKTVVNNLQLAPAPVERQILLRVRFAELDREKEDQFGFSFFAQGGQTLFGGSTGQFGAPQITAGGPGVPAIVTLPQAFNLFAFNPKLDLGAFIKALEQNSILQILAEPNLVTTNGKEAYFLVGGEFPVPVIQGGANSGAVTVQYREFGIRLRFLPNITENKTIKLHLTQEVSALDNANAVTLNGFTIPGLSTRRAESDVELAEGQSFVVAGLLDNREVENLAKVPFLGSIPILGQFFRSRDERKQRTDLILIVTPEITQPLNPNDPRPEITFPKDFLVPLTQADLQRGKAVAKKN
jgi:pilus assembly protein CpaC